VASAAHAFRHAPQFSGSVWKSVQNATAPVPHASGRAAGHEHALPEHCWPAGQTTPQAPQLFASTIVFAQ
jgi:hypothetical protein